MTATLADRATSLGFLGPETEMTRTIAAFDWAATSMGAIECWSGELRCAVTLMLGSDQPSAVWWGDELCLIHNEAYERDLLRERGRRLGSPFVSIWGEVAPTVYPQFKKVMESGRGTTWIDARVDLMRDGALTETYWNYSFTPLRGVDGRVLGIANGARETAGRVFRQRRDTLLLALDDELLASDATDAKIDAALAHIGRSLNASRTGYGEIDAVNRMLDIRRCWVSHDLPDICGRYPLGNFGHISAALAQGIPAVIEDNYTDPRTNDPATLAAYARIALRSGIVVPIIDRGHYVGGVFVQCGEPRRWTLDEVELAQAAALRLWQSLARARTGLALRESEQRYRLIFEQAHDIVFTADLDQRVTACNRAGADALGWPIDDIIGRSIADFVSPDDFVQTTAMLGQKLADGGNTQHEVTVVARDGRQMRWENNSTLVTDADARPIGLLSISRDVTERRAFDERQRLLINELNHRVKNTLSLVLGIAHQSFRDGVDNAVARGDFVARLHTLAGAHDLLTREHWEGVTLVELVAAATRPLHGERITAEGPTVVMCPKAAVAIAMALHELGTNAVKYGALSVAEGRVDLSWSFADARLILDWHERGGPTVTAPTRRGFGVKMIERALASDLDASVTIDFAPNGLRCRIDAPTAGNTA